MRYIKAIIWSIVLLIVLVALFAIIKIWGITLPEGWNRWYCRLPAYLLPHRHPFLNRQIAKEIR